MILTDKKKFLEDFSPTWGQIFLSSAEHQFKKNPIYSILFKNKLWIKDFLKFNDVSEDLKFSNLPDDVNEDIYEDDPILTKTEYDSIYNDNKWENGLTKDIANFKYNML